MDTNRLLELLFAAALRERAVSKLTGKMPRELDGDALIAWRDENMPQALRDAYEELSGIAELVRRQDEGAQLP